MPRYRFSWTNVPEKLTRALCSGLGLDGDPPEALRAAYGARPKEGFVKDAWPILLSEWLPVDRPSREWIVDELKARSLGHTEISTRSTAGQLEYLASCRNGVSLREVVLAAFHELGEPAEDVAPVVASRSQVEAAPVGAPPAPSVNGQGPAVEGATTLIDWTKATLAEFLGIDEVMTDPDGDIPITNGSSVTYVRVFDDDLPRVRFFSYLVNGLEPNSEVFQVANDINLALPFAKAIVVEDGSAIVLVAEVPADTISPPELIGMLSLVSNNADYLDSMIQERFGGTTMLQEPGERVDV